MVRTVAIVSLSSGILVDTVDNPALPHCIIPFGVMARVDAIRPFFQNLPFEALRAEPFPVQNRKN